MDTADDAARRARAARFTTMPIVLAGTLAVAAGLTGPVAHVADRHRADDDGHRRQDDRPDRDVGAGTVFTPALARGVATVTPVVAVRAAPSSYTVVQGDTVSAIAARYGLSTRDVLSANGLSWNAIIHPGQTLRLGSTTAAAAAVRSAAASGATTYHVVQGDTASGIAARLGVPTTALLAANQLSSTSVIYPGQTLRVPAAGGAPAATATAAVRTAPAQRAERTVRIAAGDTLAAIAGRAGVGVGDLLAANGLTYTSTIYAGHTLVVPATNGTQLTSEMRANARTIVAVGRSLGVPNRGIVIALAAAMQESGLRDLDRGDRDSVGVFQQRPSQGWGTDAELLDVAHAARLFFGGPHNPNAGRTAGLLDVEGWDRMSVTGAAQAVQVSAFPGAYAQWEKPATAWLASL